MDRVLLMYVRAITDANNDQVPVVSSISAVFLMTY
jgi:hypothetical protein